MGSLRIRLRNTINGTETLIWQRSGHQGNQWIRANVPINTTWPVTQVSLLLCGTFIVASLKGGLSLLKWAVMLSNARALSISQNVRVCECNVPIFERAFLKWYGPF